MDSKSMEDSSGSTEKDSSWATKKAADPSHEHEGGPNGVQKRKGLDGVHRGGPHGVHGRGGGPHGVHERGGGSHSVHEPGGVYREAVGPTINAHACVLRWVFSRTLWDVF